MHLFTANHVKLLNSCYPPASSLTTAGPDYTPNSHELSRLTYYASNHPAKLAKVGSELEKRLRLECKKAKSGNIRSRASLLMSLSIFRALATECRRDIALLSPSLIGAVDCTLCAFPSDLEVIARAASVFTAWTTYTNGHLIGADSNMTKDYLSILKQFATLSSKVSPDQETQNRTRLIGLAALTAALNSEALYNDIGQFGAQVSIILHPIMVIILETALSLLDVQASEVKDTPSSPYLAEFRTRPALERRAASIHVHIDGDKGPSNDEVSDASLHALFSLLNHANGAQLGYIMQSSFDNLNDLKSWTNTSHCCWYAQRIAEWAQYQYRYVIPTWLVDCLLSQPDTDVDPSLHKTLATMVTSVFTSPTPLINLSSSDIMSNLVTFLLRRITTAPGESTLAALVDCIASLGCHVYYSDQIQDLAGELIGRLTTVEVQGIIVQDKMNALQSRSTAIHHLFEGLLGLIRAANSDEAEDEAKQESVLQATKKAMEKMSVPSTGVTDERASRRARIPPDIWQDTLSLLCDNDRQVRQDAAKALVYYIPQEMPKNGEAHSHEGPKHIRRLADGTSLTIRAYQSIGDGGFKFLNSVHAYAYILAISSTLNMPLTSIPQYNADGATARASTDSHDLQEKPIVTPTTGRRSLNTPRVRKESLILRLLEKTPPHPTTSSKATEEDYANILKILNTIHVYLPLYGLMAGIPMLHTLNNALDTPDVTPELAQRVIAIKTLIAHVWRTVGQVWKVEELVSLADQSIESLSSISMEQTADLRSFLLAQGVNANTALSLLASCPTVQEAAGFDQDALLRRLTQKWTPEMALKHHDNGSGYEVTFRGDGISPLLKISPALMHIENISLQSLARSTRGLGVTDLREALEGRSSMSNPALVRPPSVSTLDHASSSFMTGDPSLRLTQTRSRTRNKKRSTPAGSGEVRDVLTRLGITKHNSSLLKGTFPTLQKANQG
ncbi:hypothetical protein D9613_005352 [Agrocybe pediades]|uniref:Protein EFR3 n=1 Tax=Agrocybe pediades TaxID=84607 RepID=A0A8H4R054_9AGAR|nr:hypothetical protein D9613_005352 [Agrocybe pediades]